ncbi:MAG: tetratricopeptide repeat protein [Planctomycetota bacterium]
MRRESPPLVGGLVAVALLLPGCRSTQTEYEQIVRANAEARAAAESGRYDVAIARWNQVRIADPLFSVEPHLGLALALRSLQENDEALDVLDTGIEFFPEDGDLRRVRGRLLVDLGFRRAAEADLEVVTRAFPQEPIAWSELAQVQLDLCCPKLASDTFDRALAHEGCPSSILPHAARANVGAGRYLRARELYAGAIQHAPEDLVLLGEAVAATNAWLATDQPPPDTFVDEAIGWGERACALDPQDAPVHVGVAALLESSGEDGRAITFCRRAVEVDGLDANAVARLARLYARTGEVDLACAMFDRALALDLEPDLAATLAAERDAACAAVPSGAPGSEPEAEGAEPRDASAPAADAAVDAADVAAEEATVAAAPPLRSVLPMREPDPR